jgi:hypothetical protein
LNALQAVGGAMICQKTGKFRHGRQRGRNSREGAGMREVKVVLYPMAAILQFFLAAEHGFPGAIIFILAGIGLVAVAVMNLKSLLRSRATSKGGTP